MMAAQPHILAQLWRTDKALAGTGLLMTLAMLAFAAGLWFDPRAITGAPAWMKPAKFAASTAIYAFTLAWIFTFLPDWPRVRPVVGRATALVFVIEVTIIAVQAWRGTTSHFNVGRPFDAVLFAVMGSAIALQTLISIAVAVALWRQSFANHALGWALRLGMAITIVGAASGGLMTRPTEPQTAGLRAGEAAAVIGGHTVGGPDGGPGMPVTGWSRSHGDLRVAHFMGLHAVQALAVLALVMGRMRRRDHARIVITLSVSYLLLFVVLTWQALRGQSLFAPDVFTLEVLATWLILTMVAVWVAARPQPQPHVSFRRTHP